MTPGPCPLRLYCDPLAVWIGVHVLPTWIVVQPLPCLGVCWKRRPPAPRPGDLVVYR